MTLVGSDLSVLFMEISLFCCLIHSVWLNAYWSIKVIVLSIKMICIF